jgi:hypothetical protein|tara:strand:- start:339 stop:509 length:171 start_codon:yes stop_codon:yes gene_type:complete
MPRLKFYDSKSAVCFKMKVHKGIIEEDILQFVDLDKKTAGAFNKTPKISTKKFPGK